jgi:hypothetical protein
VMGQVPQCHDYVEVLYKQKVSICIGPISIYSVMFCNLLSLAYQMLKLNSLPNSLVSQSGMFCFYRLLE